MNGPTPVATFPWWVTVVIVFFTFLLWAGIVILIGIVILVLLIPVVLWFILKGIVRLLG